VNSELSEVAVLSDTFHATKDCMKKRARTFVIVELFDIGFYLLP
jgi:hypothetical protein